MTAGTKARPKPEPFIGHIGRCILSARRQACGLPPAFFQIGRWVRDEQGSNIVEFALAAILLLTVVFGVMGLGFALYCYNVVSESAREGTRFAIVRGYTCTGFPSACPAKTDGTDTQTYVRSLGFPGINPGKLFAASTYSSTNGVACSPSIACNNQGNQVQVTVTYQLPFVIPFVTSQTLSVSNTAQMVISQ